MKYFSDNLSFLRKKTDKSQNDVALDLGFANRSKYSNYEGGHSKPEVETLIQIANYFKVPIDDLLNKDLSKTDYLSFNEPGIKYEKKDRGIPLIPITAMAGFGDADAPGITNLDIEKRYFVPEFHGLADFMIPVTGTSMSPKYYSGDILACKKIPRNTFIQWGKVYVLDTVQGAICKRLMQSKKQGYVKCISENKDLYPEFEMLASEIRQLAVVVGVIRRE